MQHQAEHEHKISSSALGMVLYKNCWHSTLLGADFGLVIASCWDRLGGIHMIAFVMHARCLDITKT